MRKITAVFFLVCILVNTGGYRLVSYLYRLGIKAEMKAYIQENPKSRFHQTLRFTKVNGAIADTDFFWEEDMKEFSYQGNMYDVISVHASRNEITLYCISDFAETDLAEIEDKIDSKKGKESKSNAQKLMFTSFDLPPNHPDAACLLITKEKYTCHTIQPPDLSIDIISPPPKMMFA